MGYSVEGTVRLVGVDGKLYKPFHATIYCDPCAPSSKRYEISNYTVSENGLTMVEPWYRVITPFDRYRDALCKIAFAKRVEAARQAYYAAKREYDSLTS